MTEELTVEQMRDNVALSRRHIANQEVIIARLTEQGHDAMAKDAKDILATMHGHLAVEVEILERMEKSSTSTCCSTSSTT